jgi:hypothetical protein
MGMSSAELCNQDSVRDTIETLRTSSHTIKPPLPTGKRKPSNHNPPSTERTVIRRLGTSKSS